MTRRPSFIVVGQGKSGTSAIYNTLDLNPAIGLSKHKELHFFTNKFANGMDWYDSRFSGVTDGQIVGEVSPSYLRDTVLKRIADTLGRDLKIIFILRRPIERVYARYLQNTCAGPDVGTFFETSSQLRQWLKVQFDGISACYTLFGKKNVLPLFFERDIATDNAEYEAKILRHIGAPDQLFADQLRTNDTNPSVMPHYLYAGETKLRIHSGGQDYVVPPDTLVFCGQRRNSFVIDNPTEQQIIDAMAQQSSWTQEVSVATYAQLQEDVVLPAAERLETAFGFDMDHWRNAPRRLAYDRAAPPAKFRTRTRRT